MMIVPTFMRAGLAQIQSQFPEAVIVGGALRDTYFGRPVKDVDVFVTHIEAADGRDFIWEKLRAAFPLETNVQETGVFLSMSNVRLIVPDAKDYEDWSGGDVRAVYEVEIMEDQPPFQIITTSAPMTLHEARDRVDFDICQIAFDGRLVTASTGFQQAALTKTATYVGAGCDKQRDRSFKRATRLHGKYPDWTFIVGDRTIFPVPKWQDCAV